LRLLEDEGPDSNRFNVPVNFWAPLALMNSPSPWYTTLMIDLKGVARRYHEGQQDVWALREIDLFVPQGESVAIVGRSGSGKSTLLHLIAGLDVPNSGRIVVGSTPLEALGEDGRTRFRLLNIGLIFQFFHLLPGLTVLENVMFPAELAGLSRGQARHRAMDLLDRVNLIERLGAFSDSLSGGEQQRVAIARSLVLRPRIVLADEPTGNLDAESGDSVSALLLELVRDGQTNLLIATHSQELANQTDRIIELRAGRISSDSRPVRRP
jgi:putative ABC transport system ATP-binding protein